MDRKYVSRVDDGIVAHCPACRGVVLKNFKVDNHKDGLSFCSAVRTARRASPLHGVSQMDLQCGSYQTNDQAASPPPPIIIKVRLTAIFSMLLASLLIPFAVHAAALSMGPVSGTFVVGSTFDVSLFLDTQGESVNALDVSLQFPPDKLQLISPSTGNSLIGIWAAQPRFNNVSGRVDLVGGIPGGVTASNGLVTKLTFRVKSVGTALVKILDNSKVLLNDGKGTDVLTQKAAGVYQLTLPPPEGPLAYSKSHPDETKWYMNPSVILYWTPEGGASGYSYVLNDEPIDSPDNISEGAQTAVTYKQLADGSYYFHIKALLDGVWGGTTHFAVKIDTTPPAEFVPEILPSERTTQTEPVVRFATSDALSGVSRYELLIVPLQRQKSPGSQSAKAAFIEAESPYIVTTPLSLGTYDLIVRAYDNAGNYRETTKRFKIITPLFSVVQGQGLQVKNWVVIPWLWVWAILAALIALLVLVGHRLRRWHRRLDLVRAQKELPAEIKKKMEELKHYRARYGKLAMIILCLLGVLWQGKPLLAEEVQVAPPLITTVSQDISNEEIFYAGGKTDASNTDVTLYLQNLQDGETTSYTVTSDKQGEWFYRHDGFLSRGNYLLWAQSKVGEAASPPSPQIQLTVRPTALQFGASRLSYEMLYLIITLVLLLALVILAAYVIVHAYRGRKKHVTFMKEVKEAEESVRRGFAILRKDIQAELDVIKNVKLGKELAAEEKVKEEQMLKDLDWVERYVGKEVWDIEKAGP